MIRSSYDWLEEFETPSRNNSNFLAVQRSKSNFLSLHCPHYGQVLLLSRRQGALWRLTCPSLNDDHKLDPEGFVERPPPLLWMKKRWLVTVLISPYSIPWKCAWRKFHPNESNILKWYLNKHKYQTQRADPPNPNTGDINSWHFKSTFPQHSFSFFSLYEFE